MSLVSIVLFALAGQMFVIGIIGYFAIAFTHPIPSIKDKRRANSTFWVCLVLAFLLFVPAGTLWASHIGDVNACRDATSFQDNYNCTVIKYHKIDGNSDTALWVANGTLHYSVKYKDTWIDLTSQVIDAPSEFTTITIGGKTIGGKSCR